MEAIGVARIELICLQPLSNNINFIIIQYKLIGECVEGRINALISFLTFHQRKTLTGLIVEQILGKIRPCVFDDMLLCSSY